MLFLTTRLPFPPLGGERLRPFYFIKYFPRDWKITLLAFVESDSENDVLKNLSLPNINIRTVILPRFKSYINCIKGIFSSLPLEIAYYSSEYMRQLVKDEMASKQYDLIFCHLIRMAPYAANYTGMKVLDISDALSLRYELSSHFRRGFFRFIEWLESKRLKKYEPRISSKFDLNLISSTTDKTYLEEKLGAKHLEVLENGIDLNDGGFKSVKLDPNKIVFFANLRAFHNVDAVVYFYRSIFPLVKERIKDAKFVIVGSNMPRCVLDMGGDVSVSVLQDVGDIRPFIEDACVSVAPMRIAAGIQNKIIQSMAFGIPVVTTTLGLGGIGAKPGKEILVASGHKDFAAKVAMLMKDGKLRNDIVSNAYALIKERYRWQDIVGVLSSKLEALRKLGLRACSQV